jgi:NitT/TauT family transport system permease protein
MGKTTVAIIRFLLPFAIPAAFMGLWFTVSLYELAPGYLIPTPFDIYSMFMTYLAAEPGAAPFAGRFVDDVIASSTRVVYGFSIAALVGLPLGLLSGRLAIVDNSLSFSVNALRAVPGITWLPLAMVWFGIGATTTIFLVALAAFFPIYLNTASGARQVDPLLLRSAQMMGVSGMAAVRKALIPASMPHILTGLRLGLGLAWAYLVLGELTGAPDGLGAVIMDARMLGRVDMIIVGMVTIALIGRLSDLLLVMILRLTMKSVRRTC